MAHTPGPWEAELVDAAGYYKKWQVGPYIADVFYETPAGEANAKLIAAAPELLAALKDAVEFIRGSNECLGPANSSSDREWIDYCVALQESCEQAVAKAEGRGE